MCAKERGMAPSPFAESDDEEDYWDKDDGFMGNDDSDSSAAKAESGQDENSPKDQKPDIVVSDFVVSRLTTNLNLLFLSGHQIETKFLFHLESL